MMKSCKLGKKATFVIRLVFRNLTYYWFRSVILLFSFVSLSVVFLLGYSMPKIAETYFYQMHIEKYRDIDFFMGISENTAVRYFSIRALQESEEVKQEFSAIIPFFEIDTLISSDTEVGYAKVMASSLSELKKITSEVKSDTIGDNEAIITKSVSVKYQLTEGSEFSYHAGTEDRTVVIKEVVPDDGLFYSNRIFLLKSSCLPFFLEAMNPDFPTKPEFLVNFYNRIYFEAANSSTLEAAKSALQGIAAYRNLEYTDAINWNIIREDINRTLSLFSVILLFIFLAVFLVMQTTFLLMFQNKKASFGIISLVGGQKGFSYLCVLLEIIILYLLALAVSVVLANTVIKSGFAYIGMANTFTIETSSYLFVGVSLLILLLFASGYYFIRSTKKSDLSQTKYEGIEVRASKNRYGILSLVLVGLYLLVDWLGKNPLFALIKTAIVLLLAFALVFFLLGIIQYGIKTLCKPLLYLQLKIRLSKKAFYQYTLVMLILFCSILLLWETSDYQKRTAKKIESEYKIDFALTNFVTRFDETLAEVRTMDTVKSADPVLLYRNPRILDCEETIVYFISMDPEVIGTYFRLEIDESDEEALKSDSLVILLPERFQALYGYQVGDKVRLFLSPDYPDQEFQIGGFFEKEFGSVAFFNTVSESFEPANNTIFVISEGERKLAKEELIGRYSKNLVYILDFKELVQKTIADILIVVDYVTYIIAVIIACFILSVVNHSLLLFEEMKPVYAKLRILGASDRKLIKGFLLEELLSFFAILLSSVLGVFLANTFISDLIIVFGEYKNVQFSVFALPIGIMIAGVSFLLSRFLYFIRMLTLPLTENLRIY